MRKEDKYGNVLEVDGDKTEVIHRSNIGEETKQILREAETIEEIKEYLGRLHKIDLEVEQEEEDEESEE